MLSYTALHTAAPAAAPRPAADRWIPLGAVATAPRNTEIFAEGETADRVYRVVSGTVRITKLLSDGRRQIAGFCLPGEFFALEAGAVHRFSAEAVTDAQLLSIPRRALLDRARQDAEIAHQLWSLTGASLDRAQEHMLLLGRKSAVERIATFLLDMSARTDSGDTVPLPMSRQDIADFLGLTIETVSRTLSQLEREGIVSLPSARTVIIRNRRHLIRLEA